MSKAFTGETDGDDDEQDDAAQEAAAALPAGVKNYITPDGLQRLKDEHRWLLTRERPAVTAVVAWAAGNGDRSENADYLYAKRRLRQIDSRIRFLGKRIDAAEVVDPSLPRPGGAGRGIVGHRHPAGSRRPIGWVPAWDRYCRADNPWNSAARRSACCCTARRRRKGLPVRSGSPARRSRAAR